MGREWRTCSDSRTVHVDYRSRWVRTERFRLQEQARRSLFGRYRNRYTNDPSVAGKNMGTANTNIVWHGRKLLALKEDSLPMELDPETLETRGEWRYEGAVSAVSLTAHPKLDYHTNELLTFSYQARGDATTDIVFYVARRGGRSCTRRGSTCRIPAWSTISRRPTLT